MRCTDPETFSRSVRRLFEFAGGGGVSEALTPPPHLDPRMTCILKKPLASQIQQRP